MLHFFFRSEREARLDGAALGDPRGDVLAQYGSVFEAVPRAAAHQPDVFKRGMAVDQEVAVRGVLVLADAALNHRSVFHGGAKRSNTTARRASAPLRWGAASRGGGVRPGRG